MGVVGRKGGRRPGRAPPPRAPRGVKGGAAESSLPLHPSGSTGGSASGSSPASPHARSSSRRWRRFTPWASRRLRRAAQGARDGEPRRKAAHLPSALSLLVFFVFALQCTSTIAIMARETGTWRWPAFAFAYCLRSRGRGASSPISWRDCSCEPWCRSITRSRASSRGHGACVSRRGPRSAGKGAPPLLRGV